MQIVVNDSYVRSRVKLGNIANFASLGLLGVGFVLSLMIERFGQMAVLVAYVFLIGAFLLLSYGRTLTRRWGPRFRQDQLLTPALRGTDSRYTLFNYAAPSLPDHILVGPGGLFVIIPRSNSGTIRFDGRRWSRGSVGSTILRGIAEGGLGNPMFDVQRAMAKLADYLKKHGSEGLIEGLEARPIVVFTNPNARLQVRNSPIPVISTRELRSVIRRAKPTLPAEKVDELKETLSREVVEP